MMKYTLLLLAVPFLASGYTFPQSSSYFAGRSVSHATPSNNSNGRSATLEMKKGKANVPPAMRQQYKRSQEMESYRKEMMDNQVRLSAWKVGEECYCWMSEVWEKKERKQITKLFVLFQSHSLTHTPSLLLYLLSPSTIHRRNINNKINSKTNRRRDQMAFLYSISLFVRNSKM